MDKYFIKAKLNGEEVKLCEYGVTHMFGNSDVGVWYFDTIAKAKEFWQDIREEVLVNVNGRCTSSDYKITDVEIYKCEEKFVEELPAEPTLEEQINSAKNKIRYDTKDMTVDTLINFCEDYKTCVHIEDVRKIELMLVGYPMEVLNIREDGKNCSNVNLVYAIDQFIRNKVELEGRYFSKLKGVTFNDLPARLQRAFKNYVFRVRVFDRDSKMWGPRDI